MKNYLINWLLFILPGSRFFALKRQLMRLLGAKVGQNVRVMNIKIQAVNLEVGNNTFIGQETLITGGKSLVIIGANCDISSRVSIVTGTHMIGNNERAAGEGYSKDIIIEDGVWIGFGVIVLPGVKIGKKSIIGAGSVVNRDIPPFCIAVGNPCKPIKFWNFENQIYE